MKAFISFARGTKDPALKLKQQLESIFSGLEIFISTEIQKGTKWEDEIYAGLKAAEFVISCIDEKNQDSKWLNFEAGAIAGAGKHVFVVLYGLKKRNFDGPLSSFQITEFQKDDYLNLLKSIRDKMESPISDDLLQHAHDGAWSQLDRSLVESKASNEEPKPSQADRIEKAVLTEVWKSTKDGLETVPAGLIALFTGFDVQLVEFAYRQLAETGRVTLRATEVGEERYTECTITDRGIEWLIDAGIIQDT